MALVRERGYDQAMANNGNIVLEHLRLIREKLDAISGDLHDLKVRTTSIEEGLAGVNRRLDRNDERLERIETRLNLQDA